MSEGVIDLYSFLMGGVTGEADTVEGYSPLTFPVSMPTVSGVKALTWVKDEVKGISESPYTYKSYKFNSTAERLKVVVDLPMMSREDAGRWQGFFLQLEGGYRSCYFGDVLFPSPLGVAYGSPIVLGSGQSGKILNTTGWNPNIEAILKAGDKIQVGDRLHIITRDTNSNASGEATLDIWPRLRSSPENASIVKTTNAVGLFRLESTSLTISRSDLRGVFESLSFTLVEDL